MHDIDRARFEIDQPLARVDDDLERDARQRRRVAPVAFEAVHDHLLAFDPLLELERSRAGRMQLELGAPPAHGGRSDLQGRRGNGAGAGGGAQAVDPPITSPPVVMAGLVPAIHKRRCWRVRGA